MISAPVTVTVTGAAGNIGYALLFRIASGAMLGPNTPVRLRMLEIPAGLAAAEGCAMELADAAFPLLDSVDITDDAARAFDGCNIALLVGARPRTAGMERADLLAANAGIFGPQGRAINDHAAADVRVTVVGNPVNTNAMIAMHSAPDVPRSRFTALMRLDHNRAVAQLAAKCATTAGRVQRVAVWGNHSADQYADISFAQVNGRAANELVDSTWVEQEFRPAVAQRGAAIIAQRGASSAASAASAVIDHVHDWVHGTAAGDWTSVALATDGSHYGVPEGLFFGMPATSTGGDWQVVDGLAISESTRAGIARNITAAQLELDAVRALGMLP